MKKSLKPYIRFVILGGTLFFLAKALRDNWAEVAAIRITAQGWGSLVLALLVTLLAHICAGWVWCWILRSLNLPARPLWAIQVYLKTNLAKYLPGNVWHYYGRIAAVTERGGSLEGAAVSTLLEPMLMALAALIIGLTGSLMGWLTPHSSKLWALEVLALVVGCAAIHPRILNPLIQLLSRLKGKVQRHQDETPEAAKSVVRIDRYPLKPLLGELGFLLLRSLGFLITMSALTAIAPNRMLLLLTAFSLAWLLGLVIPTPGGVGVFESSAIALLHPYFSVGILLSAVALFRLISILAEAAGAGIAYQFKFK